MNDHTMRRMLQDLAVIAEQTHHLIEQVSAGAGFYLKRADDLIPGDEIRMISTTLDAWALVVGVEPSATSEGEGIVLLTLDVGTEEDEDWKVNRDPRDWVDVKAMPAVGAF